MSQEAPQEIEDTEVVEDTLIVWECEIGNAHHLKDRLKRFLD